MAEDGLRTYRDAVALITGGASGIGAALGRELCARGARVVLADRQPELAERVASGIGEAASAIQLDVRDAEAFRAVAENAHERHGRIDYFFNNAGIGVGGLFEDQSLDDWRYIVDVNLLGVVYGLSAVYPFMLEQGFGHIVNTASMAGRIATPGMSSYGATKHAVVGITRALRVEAEGRGVRVSAFCPGVIRTAILKGGGVFGKLPEHARDAGESQLERAKPMDVDAFAKEALDAVANNREIIIAPMRWRILDLVDRLFPAIMGRLSARNFAAQYDRFRAPEVDS